MGLHPKPAFIFFGAKKTKQKKHALCYSSYISALLTIIDLSVQARKLGVNPSDSARSTLWQGEILRSFRYRAPRRDLRRLLRNPYEGRRVRTISSYRVSGRTPLFLTKCQEKKEVAPDLLPRHRVLVFLSFGSVFFLFAFKKKENEQSDNLTES